MTLQLPLSITLREDATLDNFFSENNELLLNKINQIISFQYNNKCNGTAQGIVQNNSDFKQNLLLYGDTDFGKTHLLQAACLEAQEFSLSTMYVPLSEAKNLTCDCLSGLENINLLCIDDLDSVVGMVTWETALLIFLSNLSKTNTRVIVSSNVSIYDINFSNEELKKILLSLFSNQEVYPLSDEQKIKSFIMRASYRGINIDEKVAKFLLKRNSGSLNNFFETLEELDQASLSKQRKLTIPFIKEVLEY